MQASLDAATLSQVEFRTVRAIRQLFRAEPRRAPSGNRIPPLALSIGLPSVDGAPGHVPKEKTMLDRIRCVAILIVVLGLAPPCAAQISQVQQRRDPQACRDDQGSRAERSAPQPSDPGKQNLSEKLAQTDGVICPPDIDPYIKVPTPQGGKMPIIPPPGSPNGDPTVRPK
jgi:hypothetical protein